MCPFGLSWTSDQFKLSRITASTAKSAVEYRQLAAISTCVSCRSRESDAEIWLMAEDGEEWIIFSVQSGHKYLFKDGAGQNMPTKFPGRYQSRLFSYVNRQYIRWSERGSSATRHAKVATTWGVQLLLYPVYRLFQSAQLATRRLQQFLGGFNAPTHPQLPPADMPIQRVLEVAESFYLSAEPKSEPLTENFNIKQISSQNPISFTIEKSPITGIATQQENGNLVLVNDENEILDILTPDQQQQLDDKITLEVASYLQQRHLIEQVKQDSIIVAPKDQSNDALPVRLFRNLIDWVKTNPVARVVDLFQEETQLINQFENRRQELKAKSQELKHRHAELKHKIDSTPASPKESLVHRTQKFLKQINQGKSQPLLNSAVQLEDPWLTTDTLFGTAALPKITQSEGNKNAAYVGFLPPAKQADINIGNSIQNLIQRYLRPIQALAVKPQQQSDLARQIVKDYSSVSSLDAKGIIEPKEWIETEAKQVGYIKHPLERILEWLDRTMFWLENLLLKAWDWLQEKMKNRH